MRAAQQAAAMTTVRYFIDRLLLREPPKRRSCFGGGSSVRQRKDSERSTEFGVLAQLTIATDGAEAVVVLLEARCHADAGPAADARVHAHVLLALVLVGEDVADDSRRRLELEQFLVDVLRVDALQVAFERAEAGDAARGVERAAPHRELLGLALHDLAGAGVPGDVVAHAAMAVRRRIHRQRGAHVRLARRV